MVVACFYGLPLRVGLVISFPVWGGGKMCWPRSRGGGRLVRGSHSIQLRRGMVAIHF